MGWGEGGGRLSICLLFCTFCATINLSFITSTRCCASLQHTRNIYYITVLIKRSIFIYNFIREPKSSQNIYFIGLNYLDYESFLDTLDVLDTSLITYTLTLFIYESPLLLCSCIITSVIYFPVFYRILFFPLVRENGTLRQKGRRSNYRLHQWAQFKKKWNSLFLFGSGVGYFSSISFGTFSNIYIF